MVIDKHIIVVLKSKPSACASRVKPKPKRRKPKPRSPAIAFQNKLMSLR